MPSQYSRHITLTQPLAEFVEAQVAGGEYASAGEVILDALRLMVHRSAAQVPSNSTAYSRLQIERDRIWQLSRDMLGVASDTGVWVSVNPAWTRILGWRPEEIIGKTSEWMEHPDDVAKTRAEIARLAAGNTTVEFENRFRTRDGDYRTLSWTAVPEGSLLYCVIRDVTETQQRQVNDAEDVAAQERTWVFTPDLLSVVDMPTGRFERVNPAWTTALGWSLGEIEQRSFKDFVHPEDMNASLAAFERVRGGNPVLRFENRYRARDGNWRRLSWVSFPEGGKIYSSARDVTEEREQAQALVDANELIAAKERGEKQQRMLQNEMAHRIKNTLSMVMAIVSQTLRHATSLDEAGITIGQRINALASAQDLLRQKTYTSAPIKDVVQNALAVHVEREDRVILTGEEFELPSQAVLGLSLAIHELATNAVKYGSLSIDGGEVQIAWRRDQKGAFDFEWREQGGPPVTTPKRKGFGSRLINGIVPSYFEGQSRTDFEADGLTYVLSGKIAEVSASAAEQSSFVQVPTGDPLHAK